MKKLLVIIVTLTLALLCVCATVTFGEIWRPGGAAYGARADAMGGAFVAVADDGYAPYYNPAGMTQLKETVITGELGLFGSAHNDVMVLSGFGGVTTSSLAGNIYFDLEADLDQFNPKTLSTYNLVLSKAVTVSDSESIGVNAKIIYDYSSYANTTATGVGLAFDLGFLKKPSPNFKFGLVGRNIGVGIINMDAISPSFVAGLAYKPSSATTYAADLEVTTISIFDGFPGIFGHFGWEHYILDDTVALRLGLGDVPLILGLTGGIGFKINGVNLDLAIIGLPKTYYQIELSTSYRY